MSSVLGDVVEVGTLGLIKSEDITGESQERAARQAANIQAQAGQEAIDLQRELERKQTQRLQPFTNLFSPIEAMKLRSTVGGGDFSGIEPLQEVNPLQDPAFKALANEASRRVFANQAARGKLGSGSTAEALQQRLVGLGEQVRGQRAAEQAQRFGQQMQLATVPQQQSFNQLMNLAQLSQASAAGQAAASGQAGQNISSLLTDIANAQAAGQIGAEQARTGALGGLLSLGGQLGGAALLSDMTKKENIEYRGDINGVPWFTFDYIDGEKGQQGTMAQLIEDDFPDAVTEKDGVKYVNYGALPIWH